MSKTYDASDIEVLSGLDPVRRRPGMYTDTSRPNHLAHEVVDNSVDEALAGYCKRIDVKLYADGSLEVSDDVRIDHVVVWSGRRKVAYAAGNGSTLSLFVPVPIEPGRNRISVQATDDQGLSRWTRWTVRGLEEPPVTTDADVEPAE